jgi:hypothetical protein
VSPFAICACDHYNDRTPFLLAGVGLDLASRLPHPESWQELARKDAKISSFRSRIE